MPSYRHTPDMGEISGFGGEYERMCQDMLDAGVNWLDAHPQRDLTGRTAENIFGIFQPDSDDAKALSEVVVAAARDCTGAMHQAVMQRLFYIAVHGWVAYCDEIRAYRATRH